MLKILLVGDLNREHIISHHLIRQLQLYNCILNPNIDVATYNILLYVAYELLFNCKSH